MHIYRSNSGNWSIQKLGWYGKRQIVANLCGSDNDTIIRTNLAQWTRRRGKEKWNSGSEYPMFIAPTTYQ